MWKHTKRCTYISGANYTHWIGGIICGIFMVNLVQWKTVNLYKKKKKSFYGVKVIIRVRVSVLGGAGRGMKDCSVTLWYTTPHLEPASHGACTYKGHALSWAEDGLHKCMYMYVLFLWQLLSCVFLRQQMYAFSLYKSDKILYLLQ